MQRIRIARKFSLRVHRPKTSRRNIQVPRAVVVEVEVRVELFAGEEVIVGRGSGGVEEIAEGVVVVGVRDGASGTRQGAHAAMSIEHVIAGGWRGVDRLMLADELQTPGVGSSDSGVL